MGYGSPAHALAITMCIMPWEASGASQENALSMRSGVPAPSTSRSSGPCTKPSGMPSSGVFAATFLPAGFGPHGIAFGYGALKRNPPGHSTEPSSNCSRWIARQVWKPLEWAEMPRMACMAIGRPTILVVFAPCPIGPLRLDFDRLVEGDIGELGGNAADVVSADAAPVGDRFGRVLNVEIALGQ